MTRSPEKQTPIEGVIYSNDTPKEILDSLVKADYDEVALCGGPQINSLFAKYITDAVITTVQTEEKWGSQAVYMFADSKRSVAFEEKNLVETTELTENAIVRTYHKLKKE